MNDFNDMVNDWKSIATDNTERKKVSDSLFGKLKKLQQKIVFGNLLMSLSFAAVFAVFIWLWNENPLKERSDNFYIGLTFMFILLTTTIAMMWYRVLFWRTPNDISENMKAFATKMLKKLRYFKWITNFFMPVYLVLLAVGMTIYYQDVLYETSLQFKMIAYGLTFVWLFVVGFIVVRKKQKKNSKEIDPIIKSLEEILETF
ncbi:hypothetical protein U8527_20250 [Kordia algicida OT-1]|uniref:Uncharacterized protein n=1 Tax=Kordia algicida OT-1 TaxID=391587 RepID=A9DKH7_9FLAO|nr:hypothetical protein [Kordia algicida]EDP98328.1 hypothetical protein KAOT1_13962 [Kordia algicida OT-1]